MVPTVGLREVARAGEPEAAEANVRVRVTQFMVAAALVARSDLACTIDPASAVELARHLPLHILPLPSSVPPVTIVMHWHERDDRDPAQVGGGRGDEGQPRLSEGQLTQLRPVRRCSQAERRHAVVRIRKARSALGR